MSEENNWDYGTNEQNINQGNPVSLEKNMTDDAQKANLEKNTADNPYYTNTSYGNGNTNYNYGQSNDSAGYNYGQSNGSTEYNYGQPAGRYGSNKSESEGFGIASLVLGIITVLLFCTCISWITGILAIIFGIIQLVKGNKKGMAIVGLITGGIGFIASVILYILIFFTSLGSYSNYDDIYNHIYDDIYDDIENSMDDGTI
ncbi:DUF4190 domain-containing protein [Roseburia sp.]|jgi:hypothetical protein|uniref:DUF4190 domain-containing protein n=1 Tax=Roseburia sp. TaxID=2049040 RepID=UPI003521B393